jgi:hypothetical protein
MCDSTNPAVALSAPMVTTTAPSSTTSLPMEHAPITEARASSAARSFKVEVLQERSQASSSESIRLATQSEAQIYARSLCQILRVSAWRSVGTTDPVTHRQYENGNLVELSDVTRYEEDNVHCSVF